MAWIVIPSLLSKRPWARIRARCEASFFIVLSKSIRCCSVRGRTYLTLMDLDLGFTYVLFWSYRENIIPKNFWLGTYHSLSATRRKSRPRMARVRVASRWVTWETVVPE